MRVLITGGAGFLGSHLTARLLHAGHTVRALDNLDPQSHPGSRPPTHWPPQAELLIGDVADPATVRRAVQNADAVVHFAAVVGVGQSMYQWARYGHTNLQGTSVLLDALLERQQQPGSGLGRLLLAGSMSVYGEGRYWCPGCAAPIAAAARSGPQLRQHRWEPACPRCGAGLLPRPTDEAKPPQLASLYALSKHVQEQMCLLFGQTYDVPTVVLRFFNAYGPGQALANPYTGVAAVFAAELLAGRRPQVFEDGRQRRDLVSVHDVATACELALTRPGIAGRVLNIASGRDLEIADLARRLARSLGSDLEPVITGRFRLGDARHCVADIGAARQCLGFEPHIATEQGLTELALWLATQRAPRGPTQAHATAELFQFGLAG